MKQMRAQIIRQPRKSDRGGFTLVELLVVIAVIGILMGLLLTQATKYKNKARETQVATGVRQVEQALEQFRADYGGYPFRIKAWAEVDSLGNPINLLNSSDWPSPSDSIAMPLGLFGGKQVMNRRGELNLETTTDFPTNFDYVKVVNPRYPSGDGLDTDKYQFFNNWSDPLVALGYMQGGYPPNPFLKEPAGMTAWSWSTSDLTTPGSGVLTIPGEMVYTQFPDLDENGNPLTYTQEGRVFLSAKGIRKDAVKYNVTLPEGGSLRWVYTLDLVDGYILWGYGDMPKTGIGWSAYGSEAPRNLQDLDGNGKLDVYERYAIALRSHGYGGRGERNASGTTPEF